MDILSELANSFSRDEYLALEKYLHNQDTGKYSRIIQLMNLLQKETDMKKDEVIRTFYNLPLKQQVTVKTRNAFYQWRHVLTKHIEDFCLQKITREDLLPSITRNMLMGRYLMNRKKYITGFKYLNKATELAQKGEQYELLQRIYSMQIEYSWTIHDLDMETLEEKWKQNALLAQKDKTLNVSLNMIRQRLTVAHKVGKMVDVDKLTQKILSKYHIDRKVNNNAGMLYKLVMIVQTALEEKKDFAALSRYLIKMLKYMEAKKLFAKHNYYQKIEMLTSICRSFSKLMDYRMTEKYLRILEEEHALNPDFTLLNIRRLMTEYILLMDTNRLSQAEKLIEGIENSSFATAAGQDNYFFFTLNGNLSSYYFSVGNFSKAKKILSRLLSSEQRIKDYLGLKGVLCTHLVDCMVSLELHDYEYVLSKLKAIQKRFAAFLALKENTRYELYLKLLKQMALNPEVTGTSKFREQASVFISMKEPEFASAEFILFPAYIMSKLNNCSYYEMHLKIVNPK